jgi:signal transduction histidine kinase
MNKIKNLPMNKIQIYLLCLFLNTINAQQSIADYRQAIAVANHDSIRLSLSVELANLYREQAHDSAFYYYDQALTLAEKNKDPYQIAKTLLDRGIAHAQFFQDEIEGIKWLKRSLVEAEKMGNYRILAQSYIHLGIIFDHQNMIDEAENVIQKGLLNAEKSGYISTKSFCHNVLTGFYSNKKKDEKKAEYHRLKALDLSINDPIDWLLNCLNYCSDLLDKGQKERAQIYYQKALALLKEKNIRIETMDEARSIFGLHGKFQKYDLMEAAFKQLLAIAQPSDMDLLAGCYLSLSDYRVKQGNYKGAYEALSKSVALQDTVNAKRLNENTRVEATKLKSAFDLAQKEQQLKTQQWLLFGSAAILAMALGFGLYFYRSRQQIKQQKTELEDLNRTKDRLFSIIAHDLRSPIGWLKDSFDLMENKAQTPEKTARFLSKSKEQVERVYNTVENLLVWALAQRNDLNPRFETVSIADIITEQMDNVHDFAQRKGITIQKETPEEKSGQAPQYLTVWADKNQLGIVLNNLLQNALKFTPSGGTITLSVDTTNDQQIILKVADSGMGMDIEAWQEQQKSQILLSKQGTAKEKGTGLGLFLVKEIVDKNGGTLAIESEKGLGTTVSIGLKKGF